MTDREEIETGTVDEVSEREEREREERDERARNESNDVREDEGDGDGFVIEWT
jgi:hypothetical protein